MVNYCTKNRACETSPKFFPRMRGSIRMNRVMMIPENIEKDNIPLSVSDMMDVNEEFYVKTMTSTRHFPWYNECGCIHPLGLSGPAGSS